MARFAASLLQRPLLLRQYNSHQIASKGGTSLTDALDYVGLDFFPDVFRPVPLNNLPKAVEDVLTHFRQVNLATGRIPATIPIRITENGWPTGPVNPGDAVRERHHTPDAMRGRVSAVSGLFIGASAELGKFETGVAARLLGPVGAAIFGGVGSLIVTGAWSQMFPSLRKADRLDGADLRTASATHDIQWT